MKKHAWLFGFLTGAGAASLAAALYAQTILSPQADALISRVAAAEKSAAQCVAPAPVIPPSLPDQKLLEADIQQIAALKDWQAKALAAFPQWQKSLADCRALADSNRTATTGWTVIVAPSESGGEVLASFLGAFMGKNPQAMQQAIASASSRRIAPMFAFSGRADVYSYSDSSSQYYWLDAQTGQWDGPHDIVAQRAVLPGGSR